MQLVDIVDEQVRPTGQRVPLNEATDKGLWHCGAHAVIYAADGQILVEKRAANIIFQPNMLDITMGGIVNAGEKPEAAVLREIKEELGLHFEEANLEFIGVSRYNHAFPSYRKQNRCFTYNYLIKIEDTHLDFHLQKSEVSEVRFLPLTDIKKLLKRGRYASFGRLEPQYKYYASLVTAVEGRLSSSARSSLLL